MCVTQFPSYNRHALKGARKRKLSYDTNIQTIILVIGLIYSAQRVYTVEVLDVINTALSAIVQAFKENFVNLS